MSLKALPIVILDANVLAPAPLRDILLRLAEGPVLYQARWSAEIIAEVKRTLQVEYFVPPARIAQLETTLSEQFPEAWVKGFEGWIPEMADPPGHPHVLAAAIQVGARLIVTYKPHDFAVEAGRWRATAVGPSTFLKKAYQGNKTLVLETLQDQARDQGHTLEPQLKVLRAAVPAFVAMVCRDLDIQLR